MIICFILSDFKWVIAVYMWQFLYSLRFECWEMSADNIFKYISCFCQKIGFDISCKMSPMGLFAWTVKVYFLTKIIKYHQFVVYWISSEWANVNEKPCVICTPNSQCHYENLKPIRKFRTVFLSQIHDKKYWPVKSWLTLSWLRPWTVHKTGMQTGKMPSNCIVKSCKSYANIGDDVHFHRLL